MERTLDLYESTSSMKQELMTFVRDVKLRPFVLKVRGGSPTYVKADGKTGTAGKGALWAEDVTFTLGTTQDQTLFAPVDFRHYTMGEPDDAVGTIQAKNTGGYSLNYQPGVTDGYVVRRLTPVECERLMGFPSWITLETDAMTRDELVLFALMNGDISCDVENGILYRHRGQRGVRLDEPQKLGCLAPNGYIVFTLHANGERKQIRANRAVYLAAHGPIPDGYVVDHINNDKSDNRIANLQLLTPEDNSHKAKEDGLYLTDDSPGTKLSAYMRTVLRYDYFDGGGSYSQLAEKYGISKARVADIVKLRGHTDLTDANPEAMLPLMPQWREADEKGKRALERKVRKWCQETPDGPRYKSIGNSFAVPVIRYLGERLQLVEEIIGEGRIGDGAPDL